MQVAGSPGGPQAGAGIQIHRPQAPGPHFQQRHRPALKEIAWPFDGREAVRRPTHQTVVESPSRGRRYGPDAGGGSGTLGSSRLGARSPMLWPKHVHHIEE